MSSSSFPDVNVWLALLRADHVHRSEALRWWDTSPSRVIALSRFTQIGILRLLTTHAAMNGKPLTMRRAWAAHDRLFNDDRVKLLPEPDDLDAMFRRGSVLDTASPKLWGDAYIAAFAASYGATVVTFDRAMRHRGAECIVLDDSS